MPTTDDHRLARASAERAGDLLIELRRAGQGMQADRLRAAGDRGAHDLLMAMLGDARPDDGILSEEGYDDGRRLHRDRVWVVDPLDGTREFGEPGRPDWAVHVALAEGGTLTAGAVALPAMGVVYATDDPPAVPPKPDDRPLLVVTTRYRVPMVTVRMAEAIGAQLVSLGSAGAKAMTVVAGQTDAYLHVGGMYEWDSAAPAAVAAAAGLHVSRADGAPLVYNRADPWLPDLLVCRPELAEACLDAIDRAW
ncbi:MAG: 3'(2'),5'-bisphosphate nucleotidase CysQ [Acidimicrobiia bacterium]